MMVFKVIMKKLLLSKKGEKKFLQNVRVFKSFFEGGGDAQEIITTFEWEKK